MAYSFTVDNWADEIAEESTKLEYQQAVIRIFDKSQATLVTPYDIETGTGPIYTGGDIYPLGGEDGRARIIGVRWGVQSGGESQANASTISAIRVQIPQHAVGRVKRGCKVFVVSAPNLVLSSYLFTVTSDMHGSSPASRTFECSLDGDVKVS
jgi:hypothetical protein